MGTGREFIPEDLDMCGERNSVIPEEEDSGLEGAEEVARAGEEEITCAENACMAGGAVMWGVRTQFPACKPG